ncbi:hypothetical protein KA005_07430 [bacterium]|nr:hypothetical protein [bacterium]
MTTLAGIELNDSLFLQGVETAPKVAVNQFRTLGGESRLQVQSLIGGMGLQLTTVNADGSLTGRWCQQEIDDLKVYEGTGVPVLLVDRYSRQYTVLITSINVTQFEQKVPIHPGKLWVGSISMIEV